MWPTLQYYSYPSSAESDGNYLLRDLHTFVPENFTDQFVFWLCWTTQYEMFQKIFSNLTNKTITTSSSSCPATKLMSERRTEGRHRYVKTTQSCSNFPNNNNSLPPSLSARFLSLLWAMDWVLRDYKENLKWKGLTAIKLKHQHPSRLILLLWGATATVYSL